MDGIKRDGNGRFTKGTKPANPGGRPRDANVRELAKTYTTQAIETLAEIMHDTGATANARVKAAEALLDRAWGRPQQSVDMQVDSRPSLVDILTNLNERDAEEDSGPSGSASGSDTEH